MRTTLALEPDVAARLGECQAANLDMSFKELVNGLLRKALAQLDAVTKKPRARHFATRVFHGCKTTLGGISSTQDMLALAEGEDFR